MQLIGKHVEDAIRELREEAAISGVEVNIEGGAYNVMARLVEKFTGEPFSMITTLDDDDADQFGEVIYQSGLRGQFNDADTEYTCADEEGVVKLRKPNGQDLCAYDLSKLPALRTVNLMSIDYGTLVRLPVGDYFALTGKVDSFFTDWLAKASISAGARLHKRSLSLQKKDSENSPGSEPSQ